MRKKVAAAGTVKDESFPGLVLGKCLEKMILPRCPSDAVGVIVWGLERCMLGGAWLGLHCWSLVAP